MTWFNITLVIAAGLLGTAAALHALLYKRDPRATWGWIAVCLMFPLAGALLYYLFGINRIRTRALKLQTPGSSAFAREGGTGRVVAVAEELEGDVQDDFAQLARLGRAVTARPLVRGNRVEPLLNGEQAYPAMLDAIESARERIYLVTYIFETNETGKSFIEALGRAVERGVDVRVIVDGVGELYGWPRASRRLRRRGVSAVRFLPPSLWPPSVYINLRNHRKVMVVDGHVAFTGGMNIGDRHLAEVANNLHRVVDVHFKVEGPVVGQLEQVFLDDWDYVTGSESAPAVPPGQAVGEAQCRTIMEGPNEDVNQLTLTLVGAVAAAHRYIYIMTPYFLPPRELIAALQSAALRGVQVDIILPGKNNLPYVHWATRNMLWELLEWGVHVYFQPPPFVHTKLFVVDDYYAQVGTANLDPRSLRLNFELVTEIYAPDFATRAAAHIDKARARSVPVTLEEIDARPTIVRFRDALAWLFSPYL